VHLKCIEDYAAQAVNIKLIAFCKLSFAGKQKDTI
jgi:hypothetical protein